MKIEHKKVNFEDSRGSIRDIFVDEPKDHCTIIFTKTGGVRGNHYHKVSTQTDYIVSGKMKVFGKKPEAEVTRATVMPGDYISWEPMEIHAFVAEEDTVFITFIEGPRGGEEYETDTVRVSPIHE